MDDDQDASLFVLTTAKRNTAATINYDDEPFSIVVKNFTGSVDFDESAVGDEWNSGEVLPIIHTDQDYNFNSEDDEDFKFSEDKIKAVGPNCQIRGAYTETAVVHQMDL